MRGPVLLAGAVALAGVARAQEAAVAVGRYRVDVWRAEHGMPENVVRRVVESGDGYLWLGMTAGVSRFDGVRFTVFDHVTTPAFQGRIDYDIQPMLDDGQGRLWIATDGGLVRYANGVFVRDAALDDSIGGEAIAGLAADSSGTLWALTDRGRLLRREAGRLAPVSIRGLPRARGQSIAAGDSGQLWLGFRGEGLVSVRPRDGTIARFLPGENVRSILRASDGTTWAGTTSGIAHIAAGRIERLRLPGASPYAPVTSLAEDGDGGLWIGTEGSGLCRFAAGKMTWLTARSGLLSNDDVTSVYAGRRGTVWVGTRHGLNRFRPVQMSPLTTRNGLPTDVPGAIAIDRSGALWLAPRTGGLYRRAYSDSGAFVAVTAGLRSSDAVTSIAVAPDGTLWMGSLWSGLLRYRDGSWRAIGMGERLAAWSVNAVLASRSGVVWVATNGGLQRLSHDRLTTYAVRDGLADSVVSSLAEDRSGVVWAGTPSGLSRIDAGDADAPTIRSYHVSDGLGANVVTAVYGDAGGAVWAGTLGGLTRVSGGRLVTVRSERGLIPELVTAITEDSFGYLWMAGFHGLVREPLAELNAVADSVARGRPGRLSSLLTFLPIDGLPSPEVAAKVQWPIAAEPNGRLWFAMERGLVSFDPARIRADADPPIVHVEQVLIDGIDAALDRPLVIGPQARRLEFEYTGVSLRDGRRVRFRYRLDGFDTAWVDAGATRTASYTNLGPGRYRFHVAARAPDEPWNPAEAALALRITPPFYRTPWFVIGGLIAAVLAVAAALRARTRVLEVRFAAVLAERTRLAREIHDTLLQGFTGVALSLRAATRRLDASEAQTKPLDDVLALAQRTLAEARRAVWDLREPAQADIPFPVALENAVRQTVAGTTLALEWSMSGPPVPLGHDVEGVLLRVGQEALTNVVKHASASRVCVALAYERRVLRLTIRDDGCGFTVDPSYRSYGGHWGLIGMQERSEQINAELRVVSEEGKGTEVAITVPYA
jgi:signal transduction histidine kinase/ligand-binding sensor domain-containing protein